MTVLVQWEVRGGFVIHHRKKFHGGYCFPFCPSIHQCVFVFSTVWADISQKPFFKRILNNAYFLKVFWGWIPGNTKFRFKLKIINFSKNQILWEKRVIFLTSTTFMSCPLKLKSQNAFLMINPPLLK